MNAANRSLLGKLVASAAVSELTSLLSGGGGGIVTLARIVCLRLTRRPQSMVPSIVQLDQNSSMNVRSSDIRVNHGNQIFFFHVTGRMLNGCATGEAKMTKGYSLPA